ncbi:hypothetical protein Egran_07097, partial [Elaphomyces granulatus]
VINLVEYDSTNIFRIRVPQKRKVIRSRDVLIDENKQYNPNDPYIEEILDVSVPERRVTIDIPELNEGDPFGVDESSSEDEEEVFSTVVESANKNSDSVNVDSPSQLLTPDLTPEPSERPQDNSYLSHANGPELPHDTLSKEIIGDIDARNIISGPRQRQSTSRRREAYATSLATIDSFSGFYATFSTGLVHSGNSSPMHQNQLAPAPKNWRDMLKHSCKDGFLEAAQREIQELTAKKTFKHVRRPPAAQVIPLKWVFTYKFDTDGFLTKFKSRLCVRGDLQRLSLQDTYAATLAAKQPSI